MRRSPARIPISNGIAMKRLADDRGEYVLIAVPVCGQGYGDEWMSNFTIDDGDSHEGFYASAEMVYQRLKEYIAAHGLEGQRIKVWGTGFSRAATVSNVLGHLLLTDDTFAADDIFIYTFGTPNTTKSPVAHPQIFNICGSFDPVPKIPFADWGFGKHGVTLYLPARETRAQYVPQQEAAAEIYGALIGSAEEFSALVERNWLIGELLEMMYNFLPESTIYSDEYQAAVVAAWGDKGGLLDKLHTMIKTLEEQQADTTGVTKLRDELAAIMSIGVTDTVDMLEGAGGSSMWFELLSSGMKLAHEHFPEKYISWVFSTDESDLLLTREPHYTRLVVFGDVNVKITTGDQVLMDPSGGEAAVARIRNQQVISLPAGQAYQITVTAARDTSCSIGCNTASVKYVSLPLQTTDVMTLYQGETITIHVPDCLDPNGAWSIRLNDRQQLTVHEAAAGASYTEVMMASTMTSSPTILACLRPRKSMRS